MYKKDCPDNKHEWIEGYYGHECKNCNVFYPYGSAPWDDCDDDEAYYCTACGAILPMECICNFDINDEH